MSCWKTATLLLRLEEVHRGQLSFAAVFFNPSTPSISTDTARVYIHVSSTILYILFFGQLSFLFCLGISGYQLLSPFFQQFETTCDAADRSFMPSTAVPL